MQYVENVCWVMLDESKREGISIINNFKYYIYIEVDASMSIDVSPAYVRDESSFIRKSKKTLLMFRRLLKKC
jgi:hypothetical protein